MIRAKSWPRVALGFALLLAGCAGGGAGSRHGGVEDLAIAFPPAPPPPPVAGAGAVTLGVSVADLRHLRRDWVVAALPAAVLDTTFPAQATWQLMAGRATGDVAQTLADGFRGAFAAQGYRLGDGPARVRVELVRFFETVPLPQALSEACNPPFTPGAFLFSQAISHATAPGPFVAQPEVSFLLKVTDAAERLVFARYYTARATYPVTCDQPVNWPRYQSWLEGAMGGAVAQATGDPALHAALRQAMAAGGGHAP